MNKINFTKGFTLIEILLSVAIVSLLTSIFTFSSTQAREKAQDSKMASESHQVELALNMYKDKNGFMPSDLSVSSYGQLYNETDPLYKLNLESLVTEGFLASIPKSPDGKSYAYGVSTDKKQAVFVANLKSRRGSSNVSNSNDSCGFVEPDFNIAWNIGIYVVDENDPNYSKCSNDWYYCNYFSDEQSGINNLKNRCIADYDSDIMVFGNYPRNFFIGYPGSSKEEKCGNYSEYMFDLTYSQGENILVFPTAQPAPKPACYDGELCICVQ